MLPDVCIIDDVYRPPVPVTHTQSAPVGPVVGDNSGAPAPTTATPLDYEETIPKRRSFSDEYLLSCRRSTGHFEVSDDDDDDDDFEWVMWMTCCHVDSPTQFDASPTSISFHRRRRVTRPPPTDHFRFRSAVTSSFCRTTGFRRSASCCGGWTRARCRVCTWLRVDFGSTRSLSCFWHEFHFARLSCRTLRCTDFQTASSTCLRSRYRRLRLPC